MHRPRQACQLLTVPPQTLSFGKGGAKTTGIGCGIGRSPCPQSRARKELSRAFGIQQRAVHIKNDPGGSFSVTVKHPWRLFHERLQQLLGGNQLALFCSVVERLIWSKFIYR